MTVYLAEKLKQLRAEKNISQEKLAQYLGVSFQAVSKWENGNTYPDITLLPDIARFFGVTVDELLQVEKLDEEKLFAAYEARACACFRNGDCAGALAVWQDAYHDMPNSLAVKEMLMSAYFDTDKVRYQHEIIRLGTELYRASLLPEADNGFYYRGQAISQLSKTYAVNGDMTSAEQWAEQASPLMHSREFLFAEITQGKDLQSYFRFANHWYFRNLFYMACRISDDSLLSQEDYGQEVFEALANLYELVYPDGDGDFEMLAILCTLHRCLAEDAVGNEEYVRTHLEKAVWYAQKAACVQKHRLTHPLFRGMEVEDAPGDNWQVLRCLQGELQWDCFRPYRHCAWFADLELQCGEKL